jgi:hypothetical protein
MDDRVVRLVDLPEMGARRSRLMPRPSLSPLPRHRRLPLRFGIAVRRGRLGGGARVRGLPSPHLLQLCPQGPDLGILARDLGVLGRDLLPLPLNGGEQAEDLSFVFGE